MDILKLLKTLNSAQSSWQLSLAVVLGMVSGFLPLTTPLNFLILFLAFTINIPLAIFFFMSVIFATLGLLLDPLFATLGYEVLTNPTLNALFTSMYNSTPALWSSYNYTILMGSFIVSVVLSLPIFFLLNRVIDKYRNVIEAKFKESKYFSWLNPYSEKNIKKKPSSIRWWASALFITVVGAIVALLLLVLDPLLKLGLQYTLSKATDRAVYIDDVKSNVFETTLAITNISILSKNASDSDDISIDRVTLKLNRDHLLAKKLDFEIISFGNIKLDTAIDRKVQSDAKPNDNKAKDDKSASTFSDIETPQLPTVSELIAKEGLKSIDKAKEIEKNISSIQAKWTKISEDDKYKKQFKNIEKRVKALQLKAKKVKTLDQVSSILNEADHLKKEIKSLKKELSTLNDEYNKDKRLITQYIKDIKTLPAQDYNNLKNRYSLDQNGAMNLIGRHFSSELEKYLRMGSKYYGYIQPYLSSDEELEEAEQKRMQGQWIKYANNTPYPDFVIRKLNANIIKNDYNFDTKIENISDNQKVYKRPIIATIRSKSIDYKLLKIDIEHNELKEDVLTTINSNLKAYSLASYRPLKQLSIDNSLINKSSSIIIKEYSSIDAKIDAIFTKTSLLYNGSNSLTDRTIKSILSDINSFKIDSSIGGTLKNPKITLNSDIDKKIAQGLEKQVSKEVTKYKAKLKVAIEKEFTKQIGDIDLGEFNDIEKIINSGINDSDSLEKLLEKHISKKAMQKRVEDQAVKSLGSQLKFF